MAHNDTEFLKNLGNPKREKSRAFLESALQRSTRTLEDVRREFLAQGI